MHLVVLQALFCRALSRLPCLVFTIEAYVCLVLQLKTIENTEKPMCFWYLQLKTIENSKKPMCWYFQWKTIENTEKPLCFLVFTIENQGKHG